MPAEKNRLHPRNRNKVRYDLLALVKTNSKLTDYIVLNKHGLQSVDFSDPMAVRLLNKALLHFYLRTAPKQLILFG